MKYNILSREQRQKILNLRNLGWTYNQISQSLQINLKTVQSVKQMERKRSNYESLVFLFINYFVNNEQQWEETLFDILDEKKRIKKLKRFLKLEIDNPHSQGIKTEIEKLKKNGKCLKSFSRRILDEITKKVYQVIKNRKEDALQESNLETEKSFNEICEQPIYGYDQDSLMLFDEPWFPLED